ncbi:MAG TPA: hypothetical protein VHZ53_16300 [Steroidobacteraceae bacterium]|jgi:hypothetical protein|nr:hypothetical protein [Steroidobacteraceae bacterium]
MASDGNPVTIPAASLVHGSQANVSISLKPRSGTTLPQSGKSAAAPAVQQPKATPAASTEQLVAQLNKHLNISGRPDQYRVDPTGKVIQQINPATGDVLGEFLISEFPALAKSVGLSGGAIIDDRA